MPAWGDKLSHDEILAVLTYIKTFWDDRERVYQEAQSEADPFPTSVPP
jgi:mono/diheme cytochrome c family protein